MGKMYCLKFALMRSNTMTIFLILEQMVFCNRVIPLLSVLDHTTPDGVFLNRKASGGLFRRRT